MVSVARRRGWIIIRSGSALQRGSQAKRRCHQRSSKTQRRPVRHSSTFRRRCRACRRWESRTNVSSRSKTGLVPGCVSIGGAVTLRTWWRVSWCTMARVSGYVINVFPKDDSTGGRRRRIKLHRARMCRARMPGRKPWRLINCRFCFQPAIRTARPRHRTGVRSVLAADAGVPPADSSCRSETLRFPSPTLSLRKDANRMAENSS